MFARNPLMENNIRLVYLTTAMATRHQSQRGYADTEMGMKVKPRLFLDFSIMALGEWENMVKELWALSDFLMPGYLCAEKQFTAKHARPILDSREAKSSSEDQEAGALAMETSHNQTLSFILGGVKENVLSDQPRKIIQDHYCELPPLQVQLYEDVTRSQAGQVSTSHSVHVFQALQYLKKVGNHLYFVLTKTCPEYEPVLGHHLANLLHTEHADLGIGTTETGQVVSQHRALVFCQIKTMLDTVETDMLRTYLPGVSYLTLRIHSMELSVTEVRADLLGLPHTEEGGRVELFLPIEEQSVDLDGYVVNLAFLSRGQVIELLKSMLSAQK